MIWGDYNKHMFNWIFKGRQSEITSLSHIGMDIHSHILPGIDDGVETIEESVSMLTKMQQLGYKNVITTPHIMWDCYRNTPELILEKLELVRTAAAAAGLSINIGAAAEYFIDEHFNEMVDQGQTLLTLPGNRLLVELPYSTPLMNTNENLFTIIQHGFQPILAHPERYTYFHSDPSIYRKLADQGCELQINVLSLSGYYGDNIQRIAEWLLKQELVTFLGTDAHKIQHLEMIKKCNRNQWLTKYPFQNEKLMNI